MNPELTLEQLYRTNYTWYVYQVNRILPREDSEDIVQEAFSKAFQNLDQYDSTRANVKTWFNKVLFNTIWTEKRRKKRAPIFVDIDDFLQNEQLARPPAYENLDVLYLVKNKEHQKILFNYYILGMLIKEIASTMNLEEARIKKVLERFRKLVRV